MLSSVRTRLTLWYIGALALVLVGYSAGVYALIDRNTHSRVDTELQRAVEGTAGLLAFEVTERESEISASKAESADEERETGSAEIESIEELSQNVLRDRYLPHQSAAILDGSGRLLGEQPARGESAGELAVPLNAFTDRVNMLNQLVSGAAGGDERRVAFQRVTVLSGASYLIVVSQSLKPVKEELARLRGIFYVAVPAALTLAGLGGWFLARKSLSPVVRTSAAARRMGAENLEQRLPVANPRDELGQLALTVNELLSRLDAAFAQQRQFMADASHECALRFR